jgi:acetate kinase
MGKIIAVNAGSSSLKFKIFEMPQETMVCSGIADRIGHENGIFEVKFKGQKYRITLPLLDHSAAVEVLVKSLLEQKVIDSYDEISAVGHRIVQGGKYYSSSTIMTPEVEKIIESLIPLAPLHNKPNLLGYQAFKKVLPSIKHVAVFDTAFHQTMELQDFLFPIPYEYYEKYDLRRYGFHGTSHKYLTLEAQKLFPNKKHLRIVTAHLGSGCSLAAIKDGKVVATSMGLTPLGGIMMGTRTGDIDPSVLHFAALRDKKTPEQMYEIFNKKSGLLGISGLSNDTRDLEDAHLKGHPKAMLANQLFVRRIADFIGQYFIRLGGIDVIVFSAGVGENSGFYRQLILTEIESALGLEYDRELNAKVRGVTTLVSTPNSPVAVAVIPTDEELMIVRDTHALI